MTFITDTEFAGVYLIGDFGTATSFTVMDVLDFSVFTLEPLEKDIGEHKVTMMLTDGDQEYVKTMRLCVKSELSEADEMTILE